MTVVRKRRPIVESAKNRYWLLDAYAGTTSPIGRVLAMAEASTGDEQTGLLRALEVLTGFDVDELREQLGRPRRAR